MIKISEILNESDENQLSKYVNIPKSFKSLDEMNDFADEVTDLAVEMLQDENPIGKDIDDIAEKFYEFDQ